MDLKRRNFLVYGLLVAAWLLIVIWQVEEYSRATETAKTSLRNRSRAIANTLSATIRGMEFRRTVLPNRLEPILNELVHGSTNELVRAGEVVWVALLSASGEQLVSAGVPTVDPQAGNVPEDGLWDFRRRTMTMEHAVAGATVTNQTIVPPAFNVLTNDPPDGSRDRQRRDGRDDDRSDRRSEGSEARTNQASGGNDRDGGRDRDNRPRRPFWARGMDDATYQQFIKSRELHGLAVAISTDTFQTLRAQDRWLRCIIIFFAGISAASVAVAWRNLSKTSDLQLRLVRTSELNTHLKEMNLAAAGLAHETRNPLNIIRGMAQLISKQPNAPPEIREKSRAIVDETDKVTVQLNEFINYSRPREVRSTTLSLNSVAHEVVRALSHDIEEKKLRVEVKGEKLSIEADDQLLRQVLFNLVINAIQAVGENGEIQIVAQRDNPSEGAFEVRDNGPGVPAERRTEIFKPYFTTQTKGTGLGLAIVQQNVQAHGWEIKCLANEPKGAIFRVTHLKLAKG